MVDQKKINRGNRKRGSRFEKVIADFLDMDVVPYSGSNIRFGYGDVRDSIWLIECKNITMDNKSRVCIKQEWIHDNINRAAAENNRLSAVIWMPAGRATKYTILDQDTFNRLDEKYDTTVEIHKKARTAVNLFICTKDAWVKSLKMNAGIARLIFDDLTLYMMSVELFKILINVKGLKGTRQTYDIQDNK